MQGREKDVIVFTKLRPFEDWGKFDYNVRVIHPVVKENGSNQ
jgi:hypothetical protein